MLLFTVFFFVAKANKNWKTTKREKNKRRAKLLNKRFQQHHFKEKEEIRRWSVVAKVT